jgi:hypothetical protein
MRKRPLMLGLGALAAVAGLCVGVAAPGRASTDEGALPDPSHFSAHVDNRWFPLRPGTTSIYRGERDGQPSREVMTVTHQTKLLEGVRCVVVHDNLYLRGRLAERTTDWYTQDSRGNVWYFGEATAEVDRSGRVTSTEGSWQAGLDGARPGIFMPAQPRRGQSFRQEFYKGHAEDHFRIVSVSAPVQVPYVSSKRALLTKEWTPLEPGVIDHKFYVRGIGTVREQTVRGGNERAELVALRRGR